ncbi:MAG: bifunctional metallophosphatase/5'-nucleotidase [Myxococcales bacterium]
MRSIACVAISALAAACSGSDSSRGLVLLHTNDEHSHLLGFGPEKDEFPIDPAHVGTGAIVGGASRRATILAQERQRASGHGASTLTVSAGDNMMGTLAQLPATATAPDYQVLSLLHYDVTTLGNHEFDFGPDTLAQIVNAATAAGAKVPIVSSNIHFSGVAGAPDAPLAALFDETGTSASSPIHRYLVLTTANGLKVGFVGIVGADAANVAPLKAPVTFSVNSLAGESNLAASLQVLFNDVQAVVDRMRNAARPDVVVALSHSGLDPTNAQTLDASEDAQIAHHVSGIDVIVSGHSHTQVKAFLVANDKTGRNVLVQQAGRFGDAVGRIALNVDKDGKVSFDMSESGIAPVDDRTAPADADVNKVITDAYSAVETATVVSTPRPLSFMQVTLFHINGAIPPLGGPAGSLLFAPLSQLTFDVDNAGGQRETALLDLAADAMLSATNDPTHPLIDVQGNPVTGRTDLAVEGAGVLRVSKLERGKTGVLGFGDLFRAVPLGGSKTSGTPGYPLTRFAISGFELRAAFEVTAGLAYTSAGNAQFFLVPSGMKFTYDTDRPIFNSADATNPQAGRVLQISQANDPKAPDGPATLIFDATNPALLPNNGWNGVSGLKLYTVATSLYVATFASLAGVQLKNPANPSQVYTNPEQAIVRRQEDHSEIKEWEALGTYVFAASNANSGKLPSRYDATTATFAELKRTQCKGSLCEP